MESTKKSKIPQRIMNTRSSVVTSNRKSSSAAPVPSSVLKGKKSQKTPAKADNKDKVTSCKARRNICVSFDTKSTVKKDGSQKEEAGPTSQTPNTRTRSSVLKLDKTQPKNSTPAKSRSTKKTGRKPLSEQVSELNAAVQERDGRLTQLQMELEEKTQEAELTADADRKSREQLEQERLQHTAHRAELEKKLLRANIDPVSLDRFETGDSEEESRVQEEVESLKRCLDGFVTDTENALHALSALELL